MVANKNVQTWNLKFFLISNLVCSA